MAEKETSKKDQPTRKPASRKQSKPVKESPKPEKEHWVHIDDYLVTLNCRDEVKEGFRIYMRRDAYQKSYPAFDSEFEKFMKRKI